MEFQLPERRRADLHPGKLPVAEPGRDVQAGYHGHPGPGLLRLLLPGGDGLGGVQQGFAGLAQRADRGAVGGAGRKHRNGPEHHPGPGHDRVFQGEMGQGIFPGRHRAPDLPRPRRGHGDGLHAPVPQPGLLLGGQIFRRVPIFRDGRFHVVSPARRGGVPGGAAVRRGGHGFPLYRQQIRMGEPGVSFGEQVHPQVRRGFPVRSDRRTEGAGHHRHF